MAGVPYLTARAFSLARFLPIFDPDGVGLSNLIDIDRIYFRFVNISPYLTMETLQQHRAIIADTDKGITITIPAKKDGFVLFLVSIWFIACAAVLLYGPAKTLGTAGEDAPEWLEIVWMIGTVWFTFLAVATWWWNISGKEVITLTPDVLTIDKKGSVAKPQIYNLKEAKNFRSLPDPVKPGNFGTGRIARPWNFGAEGTIKFDYGQKIIKFGDRLSQAEGDYILERLRAKKLIG